MATIKQLSFPSDEWMRAVEDLVAGVQALASTSDDISLDHASSNLANIRALADRVRELESDEPPKEHLEELRNELRQRALEAVLGGTSWLQLEQLGAPPETVQAWLDEHRIFVLEHEGGRVAPAYALMDCEPLPALQEIIKLMDDRTSFQIAAWFESPNTYLNGKRPRELLATSGPNVVRAAGHHVADWCHG